MGKFWKFESSILIQFISQLWLSTLEKQKVRLRSQFRDRSSSPFYRIKYFTSDMMFASVLSEFIRHDAFPFPQKLQTFTRFCTLSCSCDSQLDFHTSRWSINFEVWNTISKLSWCIKMAPRNKTTDFFALDGQDNRIRLVNCMNIRQILSNRPHSLKLSFYLHLFPDHLTSSD